MKKNQTQSSSDKEVAQQMNEMFYRSDPDLMQQPDRLRQLREELRKVKPLIERASNKTD